MAMERMAPCPHLVERADERVGGGRRLVQEPERGEGDAEGEDAAGGGGRQEGGVLERGLVEDRGDLLRGGHAGWGWAREGVQCQKKGVFRRKGGQGGRAQEDGLLVEV